MFNGCTKLKSVKFPAGLVKIEEGVFQDCTSLVSITVPYGVTTIKYDAFKGSSIKTVTLPSTVETIGKDAFKNCANLMRVNVTFEAYMNNLEAWDLSPAAKINFLKNNPLKVKGKTAKVKYSKVRKKTSSVKVSKVLKITPKAPGSLNFTKVSGNKKITINKTSGKVTVKKKLKRGTYKIKVKVMSKGNATYKASSWKTVTFKIKVK